MTLRAAFVANALSILDKSSSTTYQSQTLETIAQTAYETVLNRIARMHDFSALMDEDTSLAGIAATVTYTLPTGTNNIYRMVWVDSTSSSEIHEIDAQVFDHRYPYPTDEGAATPYEYCRRNETTFDINCPPDETNTIRIYRSFYPTADATTACEYVRMDDIVVSGMVSELYHQLGIDSDANTWYTKFKNSVNEAYAMDTYSPNKKRIGQGWGPKPTSGSPWLNPFIEG